MVVEVAVREVEQVRPALEALTEELADRERISEEPAKLLTLGIETSCDETSVAVLAGDRDVVSNVVSSSADLHERYGGVVPEIASRAQVQAINPAISEALRRADATLWDVATVAVTLGPGLIGSLIVGVEAAKTLSAVLDVPLVGVNHLEAHLYSCLIEHEDAGPPAIGLIVSGGHSMLVRMADHGLYEVLGQTFDDAAGEAFDKVARYLGLGFPGGPAIEREAASGDPEAISFPRAMLEAGYDFSFSGLKTAVLRHIDSERKSGRDLAIPDVCASFQEAVVDVLSAKAVLAATDYGIPNMMLSGGVAANRRLRELLASRCERDGIRLYHPSPEYCTDNAAMVALCGRQRYLRGVRTGLDVRPDPGLPLV